MNDVDQKQNSDKSEGGNTNKKNHRRRRINKKIKKC